MKHTHHHFLIIFAIAVTLLVTALYVYMRYSILDMTNEAVVSKSKIISLRMHENVDEELEKIKKESKDDFTKISRAFIQLDNTVPFIESLESLGKNTGSVVTIASIDNVDPVEGSSAVNGYIKIRINILGSWSAVMKTVMMVENMPYKLLIDGVRFDRAPESAVANRTKWAGVVDFRAVKSI